MFNPLGTQLKLFFVMVKSFEIVLEQHISLTHQNKFSSFFSLFDTLQSELSKTPYNLHSFENHI